MSDGDLRSRLAAFRAMKLRGEWLAALSAACGHPIEEQAFLEKPRTKELKEAFFSMVRDRRDAVRVCRGVDEKHRVREYFATISPAIWTRHVALFSSRDEYYGAVRVPAQWVLKNPFDIWKVTEQDLSVAAEDLSSGLCLEYNYYNRHGQYMAEGVYEVTAWGELIGKPLS
jgi:hypothetical protein